MSGDPGLSCQVEALIDEMAPIGGLSPERASIRLRAMVDNLDRVILAGAGNPEAEFLSIAATALSARADLLRLAAKALAIDDA